MLRPVHGALRDGRQTPRRGPGCGTRSRSTSPAVGTGMPPPVGHMKKAVTRSASIEPGRPPTGVARSVPSLPVVTFKSGCEEGRTGFGHFEGPVLARRCMAALGTLAAVRPARRQVGRELGGYLGRHGVEPQPAAHKGQQVEVERERRAGRRARNAHHGRGVDDGEARMMARPMVGLVAEHGADLFELLDVPVGRPLRRAGVEHDDVGHCHGALHGLLDLRRVVGHDIEGHEVAP